MIYTSDAWILAYGPIEASMADDLGGANDRWWHDGYHHPTGLRERVSGNYRRP